MRNRITERLTVLHGFKVWSTTLTSSAAAAGSNARQRAMPLSAGAPAWPQTLRCAPAPPFGRRRTDGSLNVVALSPHCCRRGVAQLLPLLLLCCGGGLPCELLPSELDRQLRVSASKRPLPCVEAHALVLAAKALRRTGQRTVTLSRDEMVDTTWQTRIEHGSGIRSYPDVSSASEGSRRGLHSAD